MHPRLTAVTNLSTVSFKLVYATWFPDVASIITCSSLHCLESIEPQLHRMLRSKNKLCLQWRCCPCKLRSRQEPPTTSQSSCCNMAQKALWTPQSAQLCASSLAQRAQCLQPHILAAQLSYTSRCVHKHIYASWGIVCCALPSARNAQLCASYLAQRAQCLQLHTLVEQSSYSSRCVQNPIQ